MSKQNNQTKARDASAVDATVSYPERITDADKEFMEYLLPNHYSCTKTEKSVLCSSAIGIDENDDEQWKYTFKAIKQHFKDRFLEVYHETCYNHVRFHVYLRDRN